MSVMLQDSLSQDQVRDLEIGSQTSVLPGQSIGEAIALMRESRVGCVTVEEDTKLRGVFTERDVLKRVLVDGVALNEPVSTVMTADPDLLKTSDTVAEVIRRMHVGGYRHMPVVDGDGSLVGVVSVKRIVQYLVEHFPEAVYNLPPDPAAIATEREGS